MKVNRILYTVFVLLLLFMFSCTVTNKAVNSMDLVPDEQTAIAVAEAIWKPIFGEKIYEERPFKAYLVDNRVWLVNGTLKTEIGGVVSIKIRKSDCKVLEVYHGK